MNPTGGVSRRWTLAGVALSLLASLSPAQEPAEAPVILRYALPNGLRVNLCPDPTTPAVSFKIALCATYRDEPAGKEGIRLIAAHHLLNQDPWMERVERLGGWWDPTNYYPEVTAKDFVLHSRFWEDGVAVAAQMVLASRGDRDEEAVRSLAEFRREYGDRPRRDPGPASPLQAECFSEPFAASDARSPFPDPAALDDADLLAFRRACVAPGRMSLTLVGDFPVAAARARIAETIGGIPNDRPPAAENRFASCRGGREVVLRTPGDPGIRIAYPIPGDAPHVDAVLLARLLEAHLNDGYSPDSPRRIVVQADVRPGVRLLRVGATGDPARRREEIDEGIASFLEGLPASDIGEVRATAVQGLVVNRMTHPYWLSWSVAFESDVLGYPGLAPWDAIDRLASRTADDAVGLGRAVLDESRRTVVVSTPDAPEPRRVVREGEALDLPGTPRERFDPEGDLPAAPDTPWEATLDGPEVRSLAGGRIRLLVNPRIRFTRVLAYYPLGMQEERTRRYVAALRARTPACLAADGEDPAEQVTFAPDHLMVRRQLFPPRDPEGWVREILAWLATEPTGEDAPGPHVAGLGARLDGPAPGWSLCILAPSEPAWIERLPLPGGEAGTPSTRLTPSPTGGDAPVAYRIPLGPLSDPGDRAAAALLQAWLAAESRRTPRYGPFTLVVPPIPHPAREVQRIVAADGSHLILRIDGGPTEDVLAWLRSGADLAHALEDPDTIARLRGHALGGIVEHTTGGYGLARALAHVRAAHESGGDVRFYDRVLESAAAMDAATLQAAASRWLTGTVIDRIAGGGD